MEALRILMPFYFPWFRYQWDIFAAAFFHVPPRSESKLFILDDDYLRLKKKKREKKKISSEKTSEQICPGLVPF